MLYALYNNDIRVAGFSFEGGTIRDFIPERPELLPMQLVGATADGFALWLQSRSIDLNTLRHRQLAYALTGSRDRIAVAIASNMFSISDTFTCFPDGEFVPRKMLCDPSGQNAVCDFILISSDTSLRRANIVTPNASTDGSFPKTWRLENGVWWLYKLQAPEAVRSEYEISAALRRAGLDAAEYEATSESDACIRSKNFVAEGEFFEPYESLRYMFSNRSDDESVVYENIASLGDTFAAQWRQILLSDALFQNTDRHMRNFGVIRSAHTGAILRLAPNFDNNQAYLANPGGRYSPAMLCQFPDVYGFSAEDADVLAGLLSACKRSTYLAQAFDAGMSFLESFGL